MSHVLNIDAPQFKQQVLENKLPVLVDFWAPWCMPCRMMAPILEQLAEAMDGKLAVMKVDTENPQNRQLAIDYSIMSIPNMKLFHNGKVIKDFIGLHPLPLIQGEIEKILNQ